MLSCVIRDLSALQRVCGVYYKPRMLAVRCGGAVCVRGWCALCARLDMVRERTECVSGEFGCCAVCVHVMCAAVAS